MTHEPADPLPPELAPVCFDEAWRRARIDYEKGVSAPVCAERHGVHVRTLRRRASAESWRRPPPPPDLLRGPVATFHQLMKGETPPMFAGEPPDAEETMADNPELAMVAEAHAFEVGELLMNPAPDRLRRFAFRRAAEAAARGAVAEAGGWMRLVGQIARAADPLERASHPFSQVDLARARYAAALRARAQDKAEAAGEDAAEPA